MVTFHSSNSRFTHLSNDIMYFQTKDTARIRIVTRLAKKNTILYNFFFFFLGEAVLYSLIDKRSPSKNKKNDKR